MAEKAPEQPQCAALCLASTRIAVVAEEGKEKGTEGHGYGYKEVKELNVIQKEFGKLEAKVRNLTLRFGNMGLGLYITNV